MNGQLGGGMKASVGLVASLSLMTRHRPETRACLCADRHVNGPLGQFVYVGHLETGSGMGGERQDA